MRNRISKAENVGYCIKLQAPVHYFQCGLEYILQAKGTVLYVCNKNKTK